MYGAQAKSSGRMYVRRFENDVEMYGAQACDLFPINVIPFENDVEMYGAQARRSRCLSKH